MERDHATMTRGVVMYRPPWKGPVHRRKRPMWVSWRMDETDIRVTGQWSSLSCTVDTTGQTRDCRRTTHRDEQAAKRFRTKAIRCHGVPETIPIDGREAHAAAIKRNHEEHGTTS